MLLIYGYGPQESGNIEVRMGFFTAVEEEITRSEIEGKSVVLMGDLKSKLGPELIPDDPKEQSENGTILAGILDRHNLIVVNGLVDKRNG